jgi:hypothetical protein
MNIIFVNSTTSEVIGKIDNATPMHMIYSKNDRLNFADDAYVVDKVIHKFDVYTLGVTQSDITIKCMKVSDTW